MRRSYNDMASHPFGHCITYNSTWLSKHVWANDFGIPLAKKPHML